MYTGTKQTSPHVCLCAADVDGGARDRAHGGTRARDGARGPRHVHPGQLRQHEPGVGAQLPHDGHERAAVRAVPQAV